MRYKRREEEREMRAGGRKNGIYEKKINYKDDRDVPN